MLYKTHKSIKFFSRKHIFKPYCALASRYNKNTSVLALLQITSANKIAKCEIYQLNRLRERGTAANTKYSTNRMKCLFYNHTLDSQAVRNFTQGLHMMTDSQCIVMCWSLHNPFLNELLCCRLKESSCVRVACRRNRSLLGYALADYKFEFAICRLPSALFQAW